MYQANFALEFRRLFALEPLKVSLGGDDDRRAAAGMAALGLDDGRPLVTLHVRGPGYKASRGIRDRSKDSVRNARLESYIPAVDWLVSRGYTVVRIGDASMEPLQRAGVVDLARWPSRSLGLDIQCVKRSQFFIATDSGPYNLALLCNIPCLATNMTHVLGAYPLRARDRYIVRHVDDLSEGRRMTLEDMLTPRHLKFRWDDSLYRFHDNSADEILAGVREMSAVIRGKWEPTPAQRRFRLAVEAFLSSPYGLRKLKRSGADGETPHFVGDGWATQASADIVCEHAPRMA
jgi:putative glycosyltransferase (TIGR04372 family)